MCELSSEFEPCPDAYGRGVFFLSDGVRLVPGGKRSRRREQVRISEPCYNEHDLVHCRAGPDLLPRFFLLRCPIYCVAR